jgi:HAD superfamily hydrolase (TIGR01509 family)
LPGAVETVRHLHWEGVRLGVVSSAVHHQTLIWILDRMDILNCFDSIVTSASSGFYKSTPRIYASAMAELHADPRLSVHVGDSMRWDVETAQLAGLHTVWLQTPRRMSSPPANRMSHHH